MRLAEEASASEILVTEDVFDSLHELYDFEPRPEVVVEDRAIAAWRLLAAEPVVDQPIELDDATDHPSESADDAEQRI